MTILALLLPVSMAVALGAPRIFYLNSYHAGYDPSDQTLRGLVDNLPQTVQLKTFFLDAKRQSDAAIEAHARAAIAAIREFKPDVLIVSDDDAVQRVVVPHFKDGPLPVVFCGVNGSCRQYGLPTAQVTGMIERVPIEDAIRTVQRHQPEARKLIVLSEDSASERSNRALLDPLYRQLKVTPSYMLVRDFDGWKQSFVRANAEADLIYLPTNGAIAGWDDEAAVAWVAEHVRVPVITCDDFMMPYAVFGLTKVPREQGEWAAVTALAILGGKSPADIPVAENSATQALLNETLARKIRFQPDAVLKRQLAAAGEVGAAPAGTRAVQATVNFGERLQGWDGFGVNYVETAQTRDYRTQPEDYGAFGRLSETARLQILDQIFGADGLKPGLLKMFLDPFHEGYDPSSNDNDNPHVIDLARFDHTSTTRWMRYFAREGLARTRARGGDLQIIATLYGPPGWMTTQQIVRGRDLNPADKYELAEYMISWARYLRDVEKLPVRYLSLHNEGEAVKRWPADGGAAEPHHDHNMYWPPAQVIDFLGFMRGMLDEQGMRDVGLTPGETSRWRDFFTLGYAAGIAEDSRALGNVSLITSHGFEWGPPIKHPYDAGVKLLRAKRPELHAWTTSLSWGKMDTAFIAGIRKEIYEGGVNGAIPWAVIQLKGGWIGGDPNPGTAFNVDERGNVQVRPGYYFYKQLSRAGQPGMAVAAVSSADDHIRLLAFSRNETKNPDAFVVVNLGSDVAPIDVRIADRAAAAFDTYRTTEDGLDNYTSVGRVRSKAGELAILAPARSVTTFIAVE